MIGIARDADIVHHEAAQEDEQAVDAFEQHNTDHEPCLVPLRPSWRYPKGRWNSCLSNKFASWMIKQKLIPEEMREEAEVDFMTRVSCLAGLLRKHTP